MAYLFLFRVDRGVDDEGDRVAHIPPFGFMRGPHIRRCFVHAVPDARGCAMNHRRVMDDGLGVGAGHARDILDRDVKDAQRDHDVHGGRRTPLRRGPDPG